MVAKKKSDREGSGLSLSEVTQIKESDIKMALKEIARIPEERFAQLQWEDNGCPRKRSEQELAEARNKADSWARETMKQIEDRFADKEMVLLSKNGTIKMQHSDFILDQLREGRFYQNIAYGYSAAHHYLSAAWEMLYDRHNINDATLGLSAILLDMADGLYKNHIKKGFYDNEFAPLWEDLEVFKQRIDFLGGLSKEEINATNLKVDEQEAMYKGTVDSNEKLDSISNRLFGSMIKLKYVEQSRLNCMAQEFAFLAETAIDAGSKEWGRKLLDDAKVLYKNYLDWHAAHGVVIRAEESVSIPADSNSHDMYMVHKTIAMVEGRLGQ